MKRTMRTMTIMKTTSQKKSNSRYVIYYRWNDEKFELYFNDYESAIIKLHELEATGKSPSLHIRLNQ